jgi:hypothetical protein
MDGRARIPGAMVQNVGEICAEGFSERDMGDYSISKEGAGAAAGTVDYLVGY